MKMNEFCEYSLEAFNSHLSFVHRCQHEGRATIPIGHVLLYPQIVLCVETPDHFIVELVGLSRDFKSLILKRHRANNLNAYLGQLDIRNHEPAMFKLAGGGLINLCIRQTGVEAELARRFPQVSSLFATTVVGTGSVGAGNLIAIDKSAKYIEFRNCLTVNKRDVAVRIHSMNLAIVVKKTESRLAYADYLAEFFRGGEVKDARTVRAGQAEHIIRAASFASLFLLEQLHEVTIGEFLNKNRDILLTAFNASDLVYEPYLDWQEGGPREETAINPDLMIKRQDGYWDICDLKLPLLNRTSLTKGGRRRRRFIDAVHEGLAQLANYDEYFRYPLNRAHAERRYGVRVENPRKILIVGNYENIDSTEVAEASRMLQPFEIVDYDTVLQLYLAGKGVVLSSPT